MGLLDRVSGLSALTDCIRPTIPRSTSAFSVSAIEGKTTGEVLSGHREAFEGGGGARKVDGGAKWWDDEDGSSPLSIALRGLQTFFPFIGLCIAIALAAFQKHWGVGVSFLTGLELFMTIEAFLHGALILSSLVLADHVTFLRGLERVFKQVRVAVIINITQTLLLLVLALTTTVSANVGGCKNADNDENADLEGYTDALPGFCRDKRAAAAFFWFNFLAWLGSLALCLLTFRRIRKHPHSSGFVPPGGHGAQFPGDADEEAAFGRPSYEPGYAPAETHERGDVGGYRPSLAYEEGEERLFDEDGLRGQGYEQRHDPFEDPQDGYASGRGAQVNDPYEAIRKSMETPRPHY